MDYPCGARLKPILFEMVEKLIAFKELTISDEMKQKFINVSRSTIDEKLKRSRVEIRRRIQETCCRLKISDRQPELFVGIS